MDAIHDLIAQVADERLRERLAADWARAVPEHRPRRPRWGCWRPQHAAGRTHIRIGGARGFIDDVIQLHQTRKPICRSLAMLKDKKLDNPWRKHCNIPL